MNAKSFDAKYFREKAAICQRLADGFSLNNPGRFQLMDIAEDLQELAKELEVQVAQQAEFAPAIRTRAAS
jgi:glutathione S-transferase